MNLLKKKYSIWRTISVYVDTIGQAPGTLLTLLIIVAAVDLGLAWIVYDFRPTGIWARALFSIGVGLLGWIPLAFFIVAVNGEFLAQARITATVERPLLLAIIAVGFVAVVALVLLNQITQGWVTAFGRLVRLIAFYLVYGWFSVCSMRIMAGSSMMAAMFGALTFIGEHLDKVLVYLGLVFLFFLGVLLAATGLGALSPKPVGVLIPAFLGRFLPALFSPVMSAIFLKVTYFKDPTVLRPLK